MKEIKEHKVGIIEIRMITKLMNDLYCLDFSQYALSSFKRRIIWVLDKFSIQNVEELLKKLRNETNFYQTFAEEITVNTTEMFRDPEMWKVLKEEILTKLEKKTHISIWHAGCSSGEEVYTMAILLDEMGIKDKVTIYATDINNSVIEKARKGEFRIRNMELNAANYKRFGGKLNFEKYYTQNKSTATMNPTLTNNVEFSIHNLAQDKPVKKVDLILCRNVMIYFDKVLQDKVFQLFHASLKINSYLVIGSKESMIWCSIKNKFKRVSDKEKIYQVIV